MLAIPTKNTTIAIPVASSTYERSGPGSENLSVILDFNAPLDRVIVAMMRTSSHEWPYDEFERLLAKYGKSRVRGEIIKVLRQPMLDELRAMHKAASADWLSPLSEFGFPDDVWNPREPVTAATPTAKQQVAETTPNDQARLDDAGSELETLEAEFDALSSDLQDKILDEMAESERSCARKTIFSQFYDCDCMSNQLFKYRVNNGFDKNILNLSNELSNFCVSTENIIRNSREYFKNTYWTMSSEQRGSQNQDFNEHAECFAQTVAERFAKEPNSSIRNIGRLRAEVARECAERFK